MPNHAAAFAPLRPEPLTRRARVWRSLFLSDLHLGSGRGRPQQVIDFLSHSRADSIYLVGDIFDGWNPQGRRSAPLPDHRLLLTRLETLAGDGSRIVLVPGNHDSSFRRLSGRTIGPLEVREETHHTLADGRRMLVTHGDGSDPLMALGQLVGWTGGKLDILIRRANAEVNRLRAQLGAETSTWVERQLIRVNAALHPRATYATRLTLRARHLGFDGVICGHYHIPALTQLDGITYANCGDWLDHFSAVTETGEGVLSLVRWPEAVSAPAASPQPLPAGGLPVA